MGGLPILPDEPPRVYGEWTRTGYCCRCGDCCASGNPFPLPDKSDESDPCPYLSATRDDGTRHCTAHDNTDEATDVGRYRVMACSLWPSKPEHVARYPRCTYVFVRTGGGD